MRIKKVTPILVVDRIEPSLPFWQGAMGYQSVAQVPHGEALGFVILARGESSVMFQTRASLEADLPAGVLRGNTSMLYVDVESLDEVLPALGGVEVVVPERKTFYGAREVWVRDASGQLVGFAEHHPEG